MYKKLNDFILSRTKHGKEQQSQNIQKQSSLRELD